MINLGRMKELLQQVLRRSRGSPVQKLLLAISGVSIGISLAYIWRKRKQKRAVEHDKPVSLDELIDTIDSNIPRKELTDAINRSNVWAKQGQQGIADDILMTRWAHEYADELGLILEIEGLDD